MVLSASTSGTQAQSLPASLTGVPGDVQRGKAVAVNSDLGNCLICHQLTIPEVLAGASGDIGPSLDGVGSRLDPAQIRQRIVDPKAIDPDTVMPAYYVASGLNRVQQKYEGQTILSAQQVEDLVAYLGTLQ